MDLVPAPTAQCVECDADVEYLTIAQPALLRHGGYGATEITTSAVCRFGHERVLAVESVRPER